MKIVKPFILLICILSRALSADYFVDASRPDDSGAGITWSTAKKTIQAAVDLTGGGDTVWVANGVYSLNQPITLSNVVYVIAGDDPALTIVDAKRNSRVFTMTGPGATISGMTIINGYNYIDYPPTATYGGGIYCDQGNHIISNCVIAGNTVGYGGGGVYCGTIYDSIISNNTVASQNGGGLHSSTAYRCIIVNNSAGLGRGGGMYNGYAENCLIQGNTASLGGGVSHGTVVNCTAINNDAGQYGGLEGSTVKNSIILDNTASFSFPNFALHDSTVISSCSPSVYHGVNGNITNAPLFADAMNNDYSLSPDSPCINVGNNAFVTTAIDMNGRIRIIGATVDMGPYESGIAPIITAHISGHSPTPHGFEISWDPIAGYNSRVTFSTSLTLPFSTLSTDLPYPKGSYVDTAYGAKNRCYYKVLLVPQP